MKRRFTINDNGELEDREGNVLGRVVGITIDFGKSDPWGDYRGGFSSPPEEPTPLPPGGQGALLPSEPPAEPVDPVSEQIAAVWSCYVECMDPRRKDLDQEGRKIIRDALKVATVEECCGAVRGCRASKFHMGDNDRRRKYNRLSQILKGKRGIRTTRENIDFFLDLAKKSGVQSGFTSADNARIHAAKRDVLDAYEFPGDERIARKGGEATAWLREHGIEVEFDDSTRRPRFRNKDAR